MKEIRAYRRPYIAFGIMFGVTPILLTLVVFFSKGSLNIKQDLIFISLFLIPLIFSYSWLMISKISYDDQQIKYRGLLGTKTINIMDIKKYAIRAETHTISTKPIFGSFRITINDPTKPIFGLAIDTINKRSELIINANIFSANELNELMDHIDNINGSSKGKSRAGKSVFKYIINK